MPTSETNARSIARAKGYELVVEPGETIVVIDASTGLRLAAAVSWPAALAWLVRAPRLDGGAGAA